MLHISVANYTDCAFDSSVIAYPDIIFKNMYEPAWLNSDLGRRLVTEIDHKDVMSCANVSEELLEYGMLPPDLCTGTKNVLLARYFAPFYDRKIMLSRMGENCYKFLIDAAMEVDIYSVATNYFPFMDSDLRGNGVMFDDLGIVCDNREDFADAMIDLQATGVWDRKVEDFHMRDAKP